LRYRVIATNANEFPSPPFRAPTELSISALSHLLVLSRVMSPAGLLLLGTVIWCLSAVATATSTDSPGCGGGSLLALAPVGRESQRHCVCPPSTTCKPGMGRGGGSREAGGCSTGHDSAWEAASGCESARGRSPMMLRITRIISAEPTLIVLSPVRHG